MDQRVADRLTPKEGGKDKMADSRQERRRSERRQYRVRLVISGYARKERFFQEETFTISVNAHGALLTLTTNVALGQRLLLANADNWDEREVCVSRLARLHGQWSEVAVEFSKPAPDFWPVSDPSKHRKQDASAKYPWQESVLEAFQELRPEVLPYKINAAEKAIAARLKDPQRPDPAEHLAITDALRALRMLMPVRAEEKHQTDKQDVA
jgi:hypothetical protein